MAMKYRVVQLRREELQDQCKVDAHEQWGAPALTLPQYLCREQMKRATTFSQRGSIFWALVVNDSNSSDSGDADVVAGETTMYCTCESHRFDCVIRRPSGLIEEGYSHHIGSVYTLPDYRKRGLATLFLKEVAKSLEQLPGALTSSLYSIIGPDFYDKLGWRLHLSKMATLEVGLPRNTSALGECTDVGSVRAVDTITPLFLDDALETLLQTDNQRLISELSDSRFDGREAFVTLPTRDSMEWQFTSGVHFARAHGYAEIPVTCGAKLSEDAFVLWCHKLKEATLYIVRTRLPDPKLKANAAASTCLLLRAALNEARKFQIKKVVMWDPPSVLSHEDVRNQFEIVVGDRDTSLSCARVFEKRGELDREEKSTTPLPEWLGNEKFCWV